MAVFPFSPSEPGTTDELRVGAARPDPAKIAVFFG